MKLARFLAAALVLTCSAIPVMSHAEIKTGVLTLSPMIGGITMEGDQPVDSEGLAYSLGLGYNFTQQLGLEAVVGGANLEEEGSGDDVDFWNYRLDGLYRFMPENKLVPYLAAGVGGYSLDGDDEFMTNYGAGLLYFLGENVALRADVRHMIGFNESNLENNIIYTAGFQFQFAGTEQPVKKEPVDSDGDGVTDDLDQCPDTPKGAPVDAKGCPLDTDGDGVFDYLDQCPDTPKGAPVDAKGCPLDTDGDGVFDYLDQCPDTPKGAPVDAKGCPLDTDGDGVFDYLDQCPDTPKGMNVDEKGCDLKLTLRINFDFDQAVIKPEFKGELDKAAAFVRANANVPFILLAGHTDSKGRDTYNQRLSEKRAEAVRQALIDNYGLDAAKLKSRGYGEAQPVATNDTEEGRYLNRRVELICCVVLPE
ncbi:peptidoglycan-binding outer membrane protein, OMP_b-brl and OmpA domain-containing [Syntrophotalea carbinolica DSM 2380]|uniref:Peptidoglycan-binding outer membrane protein, OMP_b-brl and OmpA domain-containing n=1 Tax=Syntrophotalea carbinolica (strain DSM 2380 / NBRC 103641 / GraBd1) TaxID=338963 RepID=Q3A740_SYNC1|nr:OmpA family protein [Syntrophotalea carbinolica]ABA87807.1 peptidoglycan-binding outer membrane protein, OMP_b-brl and OmpA domain-containing [Syntrophotalea carbinolica DSM 2380]